MALIELDLAELAARATRAAQTWAPGAKLVNVEPLTGGASSLTYTVTVAGGPPEHTRIVLKVAPPGLPPVRNRDVAHQALLMRALVGAPGVRVPTVLFEDDGDPPDVPPFHAMNLLAGDCTEPVLLASPPADLLPLFPGRAFAAATMLAALQRVDPVTIGLTSEPVTTLDDEIRRWTRAFATVDPALAIRHEEAEALLFATMPAALAPVVCHGDYRLGNMLCEADGITAIIDWEIWSLSDPRLDLAWFLFFTDEAKHPMASATGPSGMPPADALIDAYAAEAGAVPANLEWFHCLIRYKEASLSALILKRILKAQGGGIPPGNMAETIPALTAECIERLQSFTPTR
jgi:aminoglycoside phosphotransferase (APT) family kinase protein